MAARLLDTTRILAFDFDLCVCDGTGLFELFIQLLDIYQFTQLYKADQDQMSNPLPADFINAVEKAYTSLAFDVAAAIKNQELWLVRPGMEQVFDVAQRMRQKGYLDYIMFYSNNSVPEFLSFVELVIRLANLNRFSTKKPVVSLIFTAETSSRMKVERAPVGHPNAREKTKMGILQCLEDLDLPVSKSPEILFFDDMNHKGLGHSLKQVEPYYTLSTAEQVHKVFFDSMEKSGLYKKGALRTEWQQLGIKNSLMKHTAVDFMDWIKNLKMPLLFDGSQLIKEKSISDRMATEIYEFCGVQAVNKSKSRKRRGKYIK
jgi:hypothetical protein